jgi:hypothetical protein
LELDHVIIAATDLTAAARDLEDRHGLASVEGGRHPGWGTANRIVPLGETYIELVAIVDDAEAARSPFGRWVTRERSERGTPLGWAVRTYELDGVARRLGLQVSAGSRAAATGGSLSWRMAGIEQAAAEPSLPVFIEWGRGTPLPGRIPASHRAGAAEIARLELEGDSRRVDAWLGGHALPVTVRAGRPTVAGIVLRGASGEFRLGY